MKRVSRLRCALTRAALCILCTLCLFSPVAPRAYAQTHAPDTLVIAAGQRVTQSVATMVRAIRVDGEVLGDVTSWQGDIYVDGHVSGDVVSYSGTITLATDARVDGNVLAIGGTVSQSARTTVAGTLINGTAGGQAVSSVLDAIAPPSAGEPLALGVGLRIGFISALLLLLFVLTTFITLLWPRRTAGASATLVRAPWRSLALGVLTTLLVALVLLPLTTLVAMTLVGLPLVLPFFFVLQLPYVYGLATCGQTLGRALRAAVPERATALGVLIVLVPFALLAMIAPFVSLMLLYLVASAGLGAVIISRGGALAVR